MRDPISVDEVVAENLKRLRGDISVRELADRLRVGPTVVYDMEGGRGDRPQRQFAWHEIVHLCDALYINLIDLVLPPEDVRVSLSWLAVEGEEPFTLSRDEIATVLLGGPIDSATLKTVLDKSVSRRKWKEQMHQELTELVNKRYEEE